MRQVVGTIATLWIKIKIIMKYTLKKNEIV